MVNFFKKISRGANHFFKKAGSDTNHFFKKAGGDMRRGFSTVGKELVQQRGMIGNILEKASPAVAGLVGVGALALGQPELLPFAGAVGGALSKAGTAVKGDYSNKIDRDRPRVMPAIQQISNRQSGKLAELPLIHHGSGLHRRTPVVMGSNALVNSMRR